MKMTCIPCLALCAVLGAAQPALAIDPCVNAFAIFMPAHPGATDVIAWWNPLGARDTAPLVVKTTVASDNQIALDIRAAADPVAAVGYEAMGPYPYMGHFGPLPAGQYTVRVSLFGFCNIPQALLTVSAQPAPTAAGPVVEFYNAALDQYFNTISVYQIHDLDAGVHPGWVRTGQNFTAYYPLQSDSRGLNVQRFYGKPEAGLNSHFLTWVLDEEGQLTYGSFSSDWIIEDGDTFEIPVPLTTIGVCPAGTTPVYRLWNNHAGTGHRYTADRTTRTQMVSAGYIAEGYGPDAVFMCALASPAP
jgi:hypothetical protein